MPDFLVQEDGTSRIELEDGTGDLFLEQSSPHDRSASFGADAQIFAAAEPPPPSAATWKAGTLTVPSGAGSVAVTGLGGTPKAVFFYGTNFLTEDAVVTTSATGIFRGWAAPLYSNPASLIQGGACVVPAGDAHWTTDDYCINMLQTTGNADTLYAATITSFDGDGFTVNFAAGAAGGYKVVYVALMEATNVGAYIGDGGTINLGWKAGAMILHGVWFGPDEAGNQATYEWYGSAAYPGTVGGTNWFAAGISALMIRGAFNQPYNSKLLNLAPNQAVTQTPDFIGPSMKLGNVTAYPTGTGLEDYYFSPGNPDNTGFLVMWDDDENQTGRVSTPAQTSGNTSTVAGLPFAPSLVIGYTISDEPQQQIANNIRRSGVGFSVATDDFQWAAVVDGYPSQSAFQSYQRGFADTVTTTQVHAGTIELTSDGFVLTTEQDSATAHDWVWHAFGGQIPTIWIPQLYRRGPRG